jgi:peroxiredoxin
MQRFGIIFLLLTTLGLGALYALVRHQFEPPAPGPDLVVIETAQKHFVTPRMIEETGRMTNQLAPEFQAEATDGKTYRLNDAISEGPIVLIFIKDGCPCSRAAELFFNQLHAAHGGHTQFFGIIDAGIPRARAWAEENHVPFPILADPEAQIIHAYKAESSAYTALVLSDGTIEKLWPGYSVEMLNDASRRLAHLGGSDFKAIDLTDAPTELMTGCPFE